MSSTMLTAPVATAERTLLRLATAGSVDDGKSTLVGRLLFDTKSVLTDTLTAVEAASVRKGLGRTDLALLTDGLRAEREQGITIDVAYRYFATSRRKFVLADCPGHVQYTRNTVTGSSTADVIVLLVDARNGVVSQTRRHLAVAALLRVPHVVLVINKMDLVDWSQVVFDTIATDFAILCRSLGVGDSHCIPVSSLEGDNAVFKSTRMDWYEGPTLLAYLESVDDTPTAVGADLRFPVQWVVRPQGAQLPPWAAQAPQVDESLGIDRDYRGYAGKIEAGRVSVGEEIVVLPRGSHARVTGIDTPDGPLQTAVAGQSVVLRIDRDVDLSRGDLVAATSAPPAAVREISGTLCWLAERPVRPRDRVLVQHGTAVVQAIVRSIDGRLDLDAPAGPTWRPADSLDLNDIGRAHLQLAAPLPVDQYREQRHTGAFIVVDPGDGWTLAAGMVGGTALDHAAIQAPPQTPSTAPCGVSDDPTNHPGKAAS